MNCSLILPSGDWILNCDDSNESCLAVLLCVCFQLSVNLHSAVRGDYFTSMDEVPNHFLVALEMMLHWVVKNSLFVWPFGWNMYNVQGDSPCSWVCGHFNESYTKLYFLCGIVYFTSWSLPFKLRRKGWKCDCAFETNEHRSYLTNHPSSPQVGHEAAIIRRHLALSCALSCP